MALSTYSELLTSVARWLRRDDLTADIPDFVSLAEGQINRRLRVRQMVSRATITLDDEYVDVPTDFAGVRTFSVPGTPPVELQYLTEDQFQAFVSTHVSSDTTRVYTVVGSEFRFFSAPTESADADLTYWARVPALSVAAPTNWLLETSPDIYLYGALLQSAPFLKADDRIATWSNLYVAALDDLQGASAKDEMGAVLTPIPTIAV